MAGTPRLRPVGERTFLAEYSADINPAISGQVRALATAVAGRPDVAETVPGFHSLLIILGAGADRSRFIREVSHTLETPRATPSTGRLITVPVVYGGPNGPDLAAVARRTGRREEEVIRLHSGSEYLVYMVGFAPGFPYLGVLPAGLHLPRRETPRTRVPPGSVAIADRLTGIYPQETPGGWHLIGWTPLRLFDPATDPPALCEPGDRVRFERHDPATTAMSPDGAKVTPAGAAISPSRPVLAVREPGLLATVQDGGRRGYRRLGVPWSGPMDPQQHALANHRTGNGPDEAALEMTWPAPMMETLGEIVCAVAGAGWQALVGGRPADPEAPLELRPGQALEFRRSGNAVWAYLAVGGGIDVPSVLGSRSTYLRGGFGGMGGRALRAGDVLGRREVAHRPRRLPSPVSSPQDPLVVRVIPGPQEAHFTEEGFRRLSHEVYAVTPQIDRTGYRLSGPVIPHAAPPEILPEGVLPGAVQVPGDGQPIVLMTDGPTSGGYPKIATVVGADLPRLAQAAPGTRVRFRAVTVADLAREET